MTNYYYDKLIELNADGVDFIPFCKELFAGNYSRCEVIKSLTKDELKQTRNIPKTPYLYWKYVNGEKVYIMTNINTEE